MNLVFCRIYRAGCLVAVLATGCSDTPTQDDSQQGEVSCDDDGCFESCIHVFSPPGAAGERCIEPALEHPSWDCELELACPELVLQDGETVDASCVLTALRNRTPGRLRVRRELDELNIFVLRDGNALVDLLGDASGSCSGTRKISSLGAVELRAPEDPYWSGCLDDGTAEGIGACIFGDFDPDLGWFVDTPLPWQNSSCIPVEARCDG